MLKIFICAQFLVGFWAGFTHDEARERNAPIPALKAYIFLGTDCPISQDYIGVINELDLHYQDAVEFVGVIPEAVDAKEVSDFRKAYQVKFDLIVDKKLAMVHKFGIQTTPEVVVLDNADVVQYQGAIDNWYYALGKYRQTATEYYLKDAIDALVMGKAVQVKKTEAVGCVINVHAH